MLLSDIPCVTPPVVTDDPTTSTAITTSSISLGEDSVLSHATIFMTDYSCTSTIKTMTKTVTVMSSSVLTEQVCSDMQTG